MPDKLSRRDLLIGVLATGTLSATATYLVPGGKRVQRVDQRVELKLVTGDDSTGARDLIIEMWNKANPNTQVKAVALTGETLDETGAMISAAKDGSADILNLDTIHIPFFAANGYLTPIQLENDSEFLDATIAASSWGSDPASSQCWGTPFNTDVGMLFERLRPQPGVPENQYSLSSVVDGLTDRSQAFAGQLRPTSSSSEESFVVNVLEHALSRNANIIDEKSGMPAPELESWRSALEPLRTAVGQGRMYLCDTERRTTETFKEHSLPYMRNWPVEYRVLQDKGDVDVKASRVRVRSLPLGILGGQSLCIVAKSRNAARAAEFIRYITGGPAQKILAAYALAPTRKEPYTDPSLRAFIPHLDELRGAVEQARLRPRHPKYLEFSKAVAKHVGALLSKTSPELPSQFVYDMQEALK